MVGWDGAPSYITESDLSLEQLQKFRANPVGLLRCGVLLALGCRWLSRVWRAQAQTSAVSECLAQCTACLRSAAANCSAAEFCPLAATFELAEDCVYEGAAARAVLEAACIES